MQIPHVTCDFEADKVVAELANKWQCPVLSNDSDFFVFNCQNGAILTDYVNLNVQKYTEGEISYNYINVEIFNLSKFLKHYNIADCRFMAIIALYFGNDFICDSNVRNYISQLRNHDDSGYEKRSKLNWSEEFLELTKWLTSFNSVEIFLEQISSENVKQVLNTILTIYGIQDTNIDKYFDIDEPISSTMLQTYQLPEYLVNMFRRGLLPRFVFDTLIHKTHILKCQVEHYESQNAHVCAESLKLQMYGLLNRSDTSTGIKEYGRYKGKVNIISNVKPATQLPCGKKIPSLVDIPSLPKIERFNILIDILEFSLSEEMDQDFSTVFVAVIVYWIKHASWKVSFTHICAIVASFTKLAIFDSQNQQYGLNTYIKSLLETKQMTEKQLKNSRQQLHSYLKPPTKLKNKFLDSKLIHRCAEFQSCLYMVYALNGILMCPS